MPSQRNEPLSGAERQRRHRDRRRGGPPVGRWPADHVTLADEAALMDMSRSTLVKLRYLYTHIPEWAIVLAESDRPCSVTRAYTVVRLQRNLAALKLLQETGERFAEGYELATRYRRSDSSFVAYWRKVKPAKNSRKKIAS